MLAPRAFLLAAASLTVSAATAQNLLEVQGDPTNDSPAGAEFALIGAQHYGTHSSPTDNDYWQFTVTNAPKRYAFWTTSRGVVGSQDDTVIEIVSSDGTTVFVSNDDEFMAPGNMSFLAVTIGFNSTLYVNVKPGTAPGGPHVGDYALDIHEGEVNQFGPLCPSVTPFPAFIEIEPNDGCYSLEAIAECTSRTESAQSAGDTDFFQIIGTGNTVVFETIADSSLTSALTDTKLWLYDSVCTLIAEDDDGGTGQLSRLQFLLTNGAVYYIEVSDWQRTLAGSYRLDCTTFGATNPPGPDPTVALTDLQGGGPGACTSSAGGTVLLAPRIGERAQQNTFVSCDVTGAPPGLATPAVMHVGFGASGVQNPPLDLAIIGAPNCLFAVNPRVATPLVIDGAGEADFTFGVGNLPAGLSIHLQAALIDFGSPRALQITLSDNRLEWTVGADNFQ